MQTNRSVGVLAFLLFLACIPLANWMIGNVGTVCVPNGPCLIPVAPGLMAPSAVLTIGFALVLRDLVQRFMGRSWGLIAILLGTALSILVAGRSLVLASGIAFLLSELADLAIAHGLLRGDARRCIKDRMTFNWILNNDQFEVP